MDNAKYVIWSHDHCAFWRPNSKGYTQALDLAGRYSEDEAREITTRSCPRSWSERSPDLPSDVMLRLPEDSSNG